MPEHDDSIVAPDIQDVRRRAEMPEIGDHFFGVLKQFVIGGVRLENGNYPTLRLFFVQCGVDCA